MAEGGGLGRIIRFNCSTLPPTAATLGMDSEHVDITMGDNAQSASGISFPIIPRIRQFGLAACGIVDAGGMDDAPAEATIGDIQGRQHLRRSAAGDDGLLSSHFAVIGECPGNGRTRSTSRHLPSAPRVRFDVFSGPPCGNLVDCAGICECRRHHTVPRHLLGKGRIAHRATSSGRQERCCSSDFALLARRLRA